MNFIEHKLENNRAVQVLHDSILINSEQDALDLMANIDYEYNSRKIIISKTNVSENFFDLKTGMAGAILQKFANYKVQLAILGDFSGYTSKSLRDFIYESNKNELILFLPDLSAALKEMA